MSKIVTKPSIRANGAFHFLMPEDWAADEWRGGNCAAVVTSIDVEGEAWEVCILPDGRLELPNAETEYSTWGVYANHYDEETDEAWELGVPHETGPLGSLTNISLTLPAYHDGEDFPAGKILQWVASQVRAGRVMSV